MKKLILVILITGHFSAAYTQIITGIVVDDSTKEMVAGASVYFNGTFVGTYSDENGSFRLEAPSNSSMPLTVSAIGYYSTTVPIESPQKTVTILLTPKVYEMKEVVVSSQSLARERKMNLKLFQDIFLGNTSNARNCQIMNENDITFNYGSDSDTLKAYARNPIRIRNNAFGYMITYYLDLFEYNRNDRTFYFRGNIVFDEDLLNEETRELYERRRNRSYLGSRMHFFRSLFANNLKDAGFAVCDSLNNALDYYDLVQDNRNSMASKFTKHLNYKGKLYIYYQNRETGLVVEGKQVAFERSGYCDQIGLRWEGDMIMKRIGDALPYEYVCPDDNINIIDLGQNILADSLKIIEKLYLQSDRNWYFPGEDLWFSAYLVSAEDNILTGHSNNLHADLISPSEVRIIVEGMTSTGIPVAGTAEYEVK